MSLAVTVNVRDQGWVQLGTMSFAGLDPITGIARFDGYGVQPGSIEYDADRSEYGGLSASFRMRLDPVFLETYGELEQFTPVVIEDGVTPVWSGRIISLATMIGVDADLTVSCQGWGQHLKDQSTPKQWITADMSGFVDCASLPNQNLAILALNGTVTIDGGRVTLGASQGQVCIAGQHTIVRFDMGPGSAAKSVCFDYTSSANTTSHAWYVYGSNSPTYATSEQLPGHGNVPLSASYPGARTGATFAGAWRYIYFLIYCAGGYTPSANVFATFSNVIFSTAQTPSDYLTSLYSSLKASRVITEVLDECAPLVSRDRSRIAATSFNIPAFPGEQGRKYAHELIDKANSFHGYLARLSPDPLPVFEFQPVPSEPSILLAPGVDPGVSWKEPAALDGRGVYNRAFVEFEDAAGQRNEVNAVNARVAPYVSQLANPSFDVDASSWSVSTGTIARDTSVFHTSPASLRIARTGGTPQLVRTAVPGPSGRLVPGFPYEVRLWFRVTGSNEAVQNVTITRTGATTSALASVDLSSGPIGMWYPVSVPFIATESTHDLVVTCGAGLPGGNPAYVDSVELFGPSATIVDRREFTRDTLRPMASKSTDAAAQQIANLELAASMYPSVAGTVTIVGSARTPGGGVIAASQIPSLIGEYALIENLVDENTLALGRGGSIMTASYVEETDTATVGIDDPRAFIDVLRNRLAAATG